MKLFSRRTLFGFPIPFLAAAGAPAAVDTSAAQTRPKAASAWLETKLYFGTSQARDTVVTDREFATFVDVHVTPRFPDGLTLLSGYGQYRGSSGAIAKEKSMLLVLYYPPEMKDANAKIEEIRETYKALFLQESVLRADGSSAISF